MIRWLKERLTRAVIRRVLRRAIKHARSQMTAAEELRAMNWLNGKKEIIVASLTGLSIVLASAGVAPDFVASLATISKEVESGNWIAALTALASGALLLMRAAWRAKLERSGD